jgi:hypothetical protein
MPFFLPLGLALTACAVGPSSGDAPMRSPTLDYREPAVTTADGQVLGVDGVPPDDTLRRSPRVGSEGVLPADAPATLEGRAPQGAPAVPAEAVFCSALGVRAEIRQRLCPMPATPDL